MGGGAKPEHGSGVTAAGPLWGRVVRPSATIRDPGDRRTARLLATLTLVLGLGGLATAALQLMFVEGFALTFLLMVASLPLIALAHLLSRTRHWRIGGLIAALSPMAACVSVAAIKPDDPAWFAFMIVGPLFAAVFLPRSWAAGVMAVAVAAIVALAITVPALNEAARWLPYLMFHLLVGSLIIVWTRHRDQVEEDRHLFIREQERKLAAAERMETLGRMAGGVAHDFNNHLSIIVASATALRQGGHLKAEGLDMIQHAAERGANLVKQLTAFARQRPLAPQTVDLGAAITAAGSLLRQLANGRADLSISCAPDTPSIMIDPVQLEQIVLNLVANARDAMPEGGQIRVETGEIVGKDDNGSPTPCHRYAFLRVIDTGEGMDEDTQHRIFEPFFTTKSHGTGLGLATVYGIVQQSGGEVRVHSAAGEGSTFELRFPCA